MRTTLEKDFVKVFGCEFIILFFSIWFLNSVVTLNQRLLDLKLSDNPVELLRYNNGQPLVFFFYALILEILIVSINIFMIYKGLNGFDVTGFVASLLIVPINLYYIKAIFEAIDDPILRAIIAVVVGTVCIGGAIASYQNS